MKSLLIKMLRSLFRNPSVFLKFRDTVLVSPAEHLFRTRKYILDHGLQDWGAAIIDVGAAEGHTCTWFARAFPRHTVFGFEPVRSSFDKAVSNNSGLQNVNIRHLAISNESGQAEIHVTGDPLASSLHAVNPKLSAALPDKHRLKFSVGRKETVRRQRLDDITTGDERYLLVKVDVQGAELEVLKGATDTLRRTKMVLIEMSNYRLYEGGAMYHEVDAFLRQQGFRLVDIYVTYRPKGVMEEYDALYQNTST